MRLLRRKRPRAPIERTGTIAVEDSFDSRRFFGADSGENFARHRLAIALGTGERATLHQVVSREGDELALDFGEAGSFIVRADRLRISWEGGAPPSPPPPGPPTPPRPPSHRPVT